MRIEHNPLAAGQNLTGAPSPGRANNVDFGAVLEKAGSDIRLSRHAQKRVDSRDLDLDSSRMQRLEGAIAQAAEKGARNSVVMLDELAVVVDVREKTVVTAMNRETSSVAGRSRVFTNIDSVVIA
jgi:flagellar operon protein